MIVLCCASLINLWGSHGFPHVSHNEPIFTIISSTSHLLLIQLGLSQFPLFSSICHPGAMVSHDIQLTSIPPYLKLNWCIFIIGYVTTNTACIFLIVRCVCILSHETNPIGGGLGPLHTMAKVEKVERPSVSTNQGHFIHETDSPWPLHFKHSHWWKRQSRSKFASSHYASGTNGVCECKMDAKSTWIPTWHRMDHFSWSLGLFS
jgi:hypothetical protein